jgi:hypothetical protein
LVKGYPEQFVIRQSDYDNNLKKGIDCQQTLLKFDKMGIRGEFCKNMGALAANDERFNMA